jgi:hypothetical protein
MTPRVLIFSHESKRDSTKLLKALHKTLYQDGDFSLSNIVFCSDVSGLVEEKLGVSRHASTSILFNERRLLRS